MAWRIASGTDGNYEVNDTTHAVRNAKTGASVAERVKTSGCKFFRLYYGGKKHDRTYSSLLHKDYPQDMARTCPICGKEFTATMVSVRFCSRRCKRRADHNQYHKKRARLSGAEFDETVSLEGVIERDGAICQICGNITNKESFWGQPTIDHIVPMSKGGSHTWDNVQLACMKCNAKKADSLC